MAQNKEIKSLLDSLVESYRIPKSSREYHRIKLTSTRALSDKGLQRTNQFDVNSRLDGLVEKLRILNNDQRAEALEERLKELSAFDTKWTPELLSLLLLLSDRPAKLHSRGILDPVSLRSPSEDYESKQIDDESSDEYDTELWKDIDFANDSSDEEYSLYPGSESTGRSENHSVSLHQETLDLNLAAFTVPARKADLASLNEACYWKQPLLEGPKSGDGSNDRLAQPLELTELQAIRETLFMLLGLPTSGFQIDTAEDAHLHVLFTIRDEPAASMQHLLQEFCSIGNGLGVLRAFIASQEHVPLMQTFQSALQVRIQQLDCHFNESQTSILDANRGYNASLIHLLTDTRRQASRLLLLTPIVRGLHQFTGSRRSFAVLEGLYKLTCSAQSQADTAAYEYAATVFLECFDVYLRPIRQWMERGELCEHDQLLFIRKEGAKTSPEDVWEKQYALVKSEDDILAAPNFLHVASTRIFNTGKSVDLLKKLGHISAEATSQDLETPMNFTDVCLAKDPYMLSPFAELFKSAFDQWVSSKHRSSSAILRRYLADQCGLYRSLAALEVIYFCKAGNLTSSALTPIFERFDLRHRRWNDSAMITDLFRTSFRAAACIDVDRIAVNCGRPKAGDRSMAVLDSFRLAFRLPWPIANIIRPAAMGVYSQIFVLLVQLQRARFLLERTVSSKGVPNPSLDLDRHMKLSYSLRARLLHFTNSMLAHVTSMVLDVQTSEMKNLMSKAEDIDEMVAVHQNFNAKVEDQCFLAAKHGSLKQAIVSALDLTVVLFDTARAIRQDDDVGARSPRMAREDDVSSSDDDDAVADRDLEVVSGRGQVQNSDLVSKLIYEKLARIATRLTQLHGFIAAGVSSLSRSDTSLCWEVLAANLNAGQKT